MGRDAYVLVGLEGAENDIPLPEFQVKSIMLVDLRALLKMMPLERSQRWSMGRLDGRRIRESMVVTSALLSSSVEPGSALDAEL